MKAIEFKVEDQFIKMSSSNKGGSIESVFISSEFSESQTIVNRILRFSRLLMNMKLSEEQVDSYVGIVQNNAYNLLQMVDNFIAKYKHRVFKINGTIQQKVIYSSEFINSLSHEIRTPINGILGFAQLLNDRNVRLDKRTMCTYIILNNANKLERVVNSILNYSLLYSTEQIA